MIGGLIPIPVGTFELILIPQLVPWTFPKAKELDLKLILIDSSSNLGISISPRSEARNARRPREDRQSTPREVIAVDPVPAPDGTARHRRRTRDCRRDHGTPR